MLMSTVVVAGLSYSLVKSSGLAIFKTSMGGFSGILISSFAFFTDTSNSLIFRDLGFSSTFKVSGVFFSPLTTG